MCKDVFGGMFVFFLGILFIALILTGILNFLLPPKYRKWWIQLLIFLGFIILLLVAVYWLLSGISLRC